MGHEGIAITYNYAHLYPSKQKALADKLDEDRKENEAEKLLEDMTESNVENDDK